MAKMVAHLGKMKIGNLQGIEKHNKRLYKNHSNADIDTNKSYLNYDLVACPNSYKDAYQHEMDEHYNGKRKVRSDATVVDEWIFSASNEFFQGLSKDDEKRFFQSCLDFMQERYGHVIYATVHKDESTPHMHMGLVPLTDDGRLSHKDIFGRNSLKALHANLYEHLKSNGFNIEKPQPNDSKHLSVKDFKAKALDDKIAKNKQILQDQQLQYAKKQNEFKEQAKQKQDEVKAVIDNYKQNALNDLNNKEKALNARETALKERESTYKATLDKQYQDAYNERKKTLDAFYKSENDKLTERESKLRESEYRNDEREKDIEKRVEKVKHDEQNFASKYKKAVRLVKNADEIEKRMDEKIGMYQRLQTSKYDSAFIQSLKLTMTDIYGKTQTDRIFDIARDNLDNINSVDTYEYDEYKQTPKSKQTDDLEY